MMEPNHPYQRFIDSDKEDLTLRDYLAIDRTLLANERSFLAYTRTAITLLIAAISLIKLFDVLLLKWLGGVMIAAAVIVMVRGFRRFKATQHVFEELEGLHNDPTATDHKAISQRFLQISKKLVHVFYK